MSYKLRGTEHLVYWRRVEVFSGIYGFGDLYQKFGKRPIGGQYRQRYLGLYKPWHNTLHIEQNQER